MSSERDIKKESLSKTKRLFLLLAMVIIICITVVLMLKKQPDITQDPFQQEVQSLQKMLPLRIHAYIELKNIEVVEAEIKYSFVVTDDLA